MFKLRLFVLAAALAGLAGGLFTFYVQFLGPEDFTIVLSLQFVVMVAVGGLGNVYGAVVGTVSILYLEHKLRAGARETLWRDLAAASADDSLARGLRLHPDSGHALLPARPASRHCSTVCAVCGGV